MQTKIITSKDNKEFKFFKKVAENKSKNYCLLEGEHLILAFAEKFGDSAFKYFLVRENQNQNQNKNIKNIDKKENQIFKKNFANLVEIRQNLYCSLSNLSTPSDFMAIVEIPKNNVKNINLQLDSVILDEIQDPGNLGTILRTAAATGFSQILLSANCAKVYTPKVLRSAQGANFVVNIFENLSDDELSKFLENFAGNSLTTALLDNFDKQNNLFLADFCKKDKNKNLPLAWIFGSEGNGVRKFLQNKTQYKIFIPMQNRNHCVESLNVATSAAICLFETLRRRSFL